MITRYDDAAVSLSPKVADFMRSRVSARPAGSLQCLARSQSANADSSRELVLVRGAPSDSARPRSTDLICFGTKRPPVQIRPPRPRSRPCPSGSWPFSCRTAAKYSNGEVPGCLPSADLALLMQKRTRQCSCRVRRTNRMSHMHSQPTRWASTCRALPFTNGQARGRVPLDVKNRPRAAGSPRHALAGRGAVGQAAGGERVRQAYAAVFRQVRRPLCLRPRGTGRPA
jgi:hypothetical protein